MIACLAPLSGCGGGEATTSVHGVVTYDGKAVPFGHPENILGTHWLAMKPTGNTPLVAGYGIHGTWDDASIGKAESAGCVRMHNADVEQLYVLLPVGTAVEIVE